MEALRVVTPLAANRQTTDVLSLRVREAVPADLPYVVDTYMRSRARTENQHSHKRFDNYRATFVALVTRGSRLLIAADDIEPSLILGWSLTEAGLLHYVYTREAFRGQGVMLSLLANAGLTRSPALCTHWSRDVSHSAKFRYIGTIPYEVAQ